MSSARPSPSTEEPAGSAIAPVDDPRALWILNAEHASLVASRSLAYNEAFSRAGMFLTFVSASLIVIGFLIGNQALSSAVVPVGIVLLLADLYIGVATAGRLIDASAEELRCVRGMNRIRHAYAEMVPGLEPYFITGFTDDAHGVLSTYGSLAVETNVLRNIAHGLTTSIGMVATLDAMLLGALCALIALGLGAGSALAIAVALVAFGIGIAVFVVVGNRTAVGNQARAESRFPTRPGDLPKG